MFPREEVLPSRRRLIPSAPAEEEEEVLGDVPALHNRDFDERGNLKKGFPKAVIVFFAPWCGHCRHFAPTFAEFAASASGPKLLVGAVDGTQETDLLRRIPYKIEGYPTVIGYRNGRYKQVFEGPRTLEALQSFASSL